MLVYVAGPYRGKSRFRLIRFFQVLRNIWRARRVAAQLWAKGFVAICPHLNTFLMDNVCPQEWFLEGDLEILAKCDAVVVLPRYHESTGALGEIRFAQEHRIPVFYSVADCVGWVSLKEQLRGALRMPEIKGVGPDAEIVTNEQGGKQSKAVAAFNLMDAPTMIRLAKVLQYGASRYERDNWRKIPCEEHLNHALAHIFAHLAGDRQDDHLGHAFCRLMMACATEDDGSVERRPEW